MPYVSEPDQYAVQYLQENFRLLSEEDMLRVGFRIELKEHMTPRRAYRIGSCHAAVRYLKCPDCETFYVMIFSAGEQQPARNSVFVAGVWHVAKTCSR